jgi:hypothetical protein
MPCACHASSPRRTCSLCGLLDSHHARYKRAAYRLYDHVRVQRLPHQLDIARQDTRNLRRRQMLSHFIDTRALRMRKNMAAFVRVWCNGRGAVSRGIAG